MTGPVNLGNPVEIDHPGDRRADSGQDRLGLRDRLRAAAGGRSRSSGSRTFRSPRQALGWAAERGFGPWASTNTIAYFQRTVAPDAPPLPQAQPELQEEPQPAAQPETRNGAQDDARNGARTAPQQAPQRETQQVAPAESWAGRAPSALGGGAEPAIGSPRPSSQARRRRPTELREPRDVEQLARRAVGLGRHRRLRLARKADRLGDQGSASPSRWRCPCRRRR